MHQPPTRRKMILTAKRFILLLVLVWAVASAPAKAQDFAQYCNERYGFCVAYPATLTAEESPANDDGGGFSDSHGFSMTVSGINNVLEATLQSEMKSQAQEIAKITYQTKGKNWFVLSGHKGSDVVYLKIYIGKESINHLFIKYPAKKSAEYAEAVAKISRSFKPGDLEAPH